MYSSLLSSLIMIVSILIVMAFYTLVERKFLGYCQLRKGPNKPSLSGLPVPLADAVKLFSKEQLKPIMSNLTPFYLAPTSALFIALMLSNLVPTNSAINALDYSAPMFSAIASLNIYSTLTAGWASNSKYAIMGTVRGMAQTISYEVGMSLCMLFALIVLTSLSLSSSYSTFSWPILLCPMFVPIWLGTILAETNRTPYDLMEGESELVSGFNIEYSAGPFALIFMAEYTSIVVMSMFSVLLFTPGANMLIFVMKTLFITLFFLWARGTLPRMRYDNLMYLMWLSFLPLTLGVALMYMALFTILENSLKKIYTLEV